MAFQKAIFDNKKLIDIELKGCLLTIVNYGLGRHYFYIEGSWDLFTRSEEMTLSEKECFKTPIIVRSFNG